MVNKYGLFWVKLLEKRLKYEDLRGFPILNLLENRLFLFYFFAFSLNLNVKKAPRNWGFYKF